MGLFSENVGRKMRLPMLAASFCAAVLAVVCAGSRAAQVRMRRHDASLARLSASATALYGRREYAAASTVWERAYARAQSLGDAQSAVSFMSNAAGAHFALGDYQGAIRRYTMARDAARRSANQHMLAVIGANLGSLYAQIGDMNAAGQAAAEAARSASGASAAESAQMLLGLGLLRGAAGRNTEAGEYFRAGLQQAARAGDNKILIEGCTHYALQLLAEGDMQAAEDAASRAYYLATEAPTVDLRPVLRVTARVQRLRGRLRLAGRLLDDALAIRPRASDNNLWHMYLLQERGLVRLAQHRRGDALNDFRRALELAQAWREGISPSDVLRSGATYWLHDLYTVFIETAAMQPGGSTEAFLATEEERAASLMETLARRSRELHPERADRYWKALAALRRAETAMLADGTPLAAARFEQARQSVVELEATSGLAWVNGTAIPAGDKSGEKISRAQALTNFQRALPRDSALLSVRLGERTSFLWALTDHGLEMHRLAPSRDLTALAEVFRNAVEGHAADRDERGQQLYSALFGGLSTAAVAKREWIVAADGPIFAAPIDALVTTRKDGRPVYAIERHVLRRVPSAAVLASSGTGPSQGFLGVGDGVYNSADPRLSTNPHAWFSLTAAASNSLELPRLPGSRRELLNTSQAWGGTASFLTGFDASLARVRVELSRGPAVVHISAHVMQPPGRPGDAVVHLGMDRRRRPDILTAADIAALDVPGSLVVMDGCSSGTAGALTGAGVQGLTRAWLIAGARAVVSSRWPVPDDSGEMFTPFYRGLRHRAAAGISGDAVAAALHDAQLEMLHSGTWRSDPRFWSGFYVLSR